MAYATIAGPARPDRPLYRAGADGGLRRPRHLAGPQRQHDHHARHPLRERAGRSRARGRARRPRHRLGDARHDGGRDPAPGAPAAGSASSPTSSPSRSSPASRPASGWSSSWTSCPRSSASTSTRPGGSATWPRSSATCRRLDPDAGRRAGHARDRHRPRALRPRAARAAARRWPAASRRPLFLGLQASAWPSSGTSPAGFRACVRPDLALLEALWPAAVAMALMSFTETIAAGRAFTAPGEPRPDPNQELVATGAANAGGRALGRHARRRRDLADGGEPQGGRAHAGGRRW